MKKIGVGIISWNRPHYLEKLLHSLEINDLSEVDFHLFQDGSICKFTGQEVAKVENISASIKAFSDSKLTNKHYHIRDNNVSVAINQFEAMQFLCENYSQFIFLEDDVIVSPNFIIIMKKLLKQFEKDKRVACISSGLSLLCEEDKIKENMDKLIFDKGHFWAECCWSEKWKIIEKEYMAYYNIVKDGPYKRRDDNAIKNLFESNGTAVLTTSQDQGKDWAITKTGMRRARLIVNRATGIGDWGIHSNPEKLKESGDGHNKIYSFDEELEIKEFKL